MFRLRTVIISLSLLSIFVATPFARSIMEKKIQYLTNTGKAGEARFWAIFLGNHDCKLLRKSPGTAEKEIVASVNLQFLSSGYLEGNGYGVSGKVQSLPTMEIKSPAGQHKISIDSIDFIYDYGTKVSLVGGESGDFIINVEGDLKTATKFIMREYKLTQYFGEEILKEGSDEISLSVIAFSKEGLARARAAQAKVDPGQ